MDHRNTARLPRTLFRLITSTLLGLCALAGLPAPAAEDDPPGRVGRLAQLDGPVSLLDADRGDWRPIDTDTERNRPLTTGDRLATGPRARAELRVGTSVLRLGERSEIELSRLDDERLVVRVHRGSLALRVASREAAEETEVVTGEVRVAPVRAGLYRIDRKLDGENDRTLLQAWRGTLRVDGGPAVDSGERLVLWRDGARLRHRDVSAESDEFADWVAREDRRDAQVEERFAQAGERRVSPEMTGVEELERHGRWDNHPEHGWVWLPRDVAPGWEPYRDGRWVWLRPWGWTWVDRAPWGFAPFHYGRWVVWGGRWAWWPGPYTARPVYSPALVVWAGTPNLNVSVHIGGPGVGWAPLPPRAPYRPWYRHTERHIERVDVWNPAWGPRMVQRPTPGAPDSLLVRPIEQHRAQPGADAVGPVREVGRDRRDDRRDDRQDDRRDDRRDDRHDRRDDRRDDRRPDGFRPAPPMAAVPVAPRPVQAPPAASPPAPAAPAPAAAPARGGERNGIAERLIERHREAAKDTAKDSKDADEGRKQAPQRPDRLPQR